MAITWGSTTLKVIYGTYSALNAPAGIVEIPILPNLFDITSPASVIQQSGRERYKVSFEACVADLSEYNTLLADYISATERTFADGSGTSLTGIIFEISPPQVSATFIKYRMTVMEA